MLTPARGEQWGVLGGAFDPVHLGHLTLAAEIRRIKKLSGIVFIPTCSHPVKKEQAFASFEDRVAMLELAVVDHDFFFISRIEHERRLSGYTLDTVRALKKEYPEVAFHFIIGADNFEQIKSWHRPEEIFKEVNVIAGSRPDYVESARDNNVIGTVEFVPTRLVDVSSTGVREAVKSGEAVRELDRMVGQPVREYILRRGLYR
ncbi:MAG: nicotinate-nucleotide adenylyltransferase [candidate division Zixibacteria bacterium]|nr:nicotinate-nucleotide adenylyltransferase [candidate division Zixibacteria bacterium]